MRHECNVGILDIGKNANQHSQYMGSDLAFFTKSRPDMFVNRLIACIVQPFQLKRSLLEATVILDAKLSVNAVSVNAAVLHLAGRAAWKPSMCL